MTPVVLGLGVNVWVPVHFGGRRLQDLGLYPLGKPEHVDGAVNARLRRLHGIALIMDRRRGTSQVVDLIHLHVQRKRHVMAHQFETLVVEQMFDVAARSAKEIIDTNDVGASGQEALTKVRAEKTRTASHQYPLFKMHLCSHVTVL